jgi:hypothetical protein
MNIETSIETSIASSIPMSIRTETGHPNEMSIEMSTEARIATDRAEILIDIVMTTRTHPPDAMTDFLRQRGTAIARVAATVESTFGWCFNRGT